MRQDDLPNAVARVVGPGGTAGTAFLLSHEHGLLATCAHVVEYAQAGPGERVELVFQAGGGPIPALVDPERWLPSQAEDVAVLRVTDRLPEGADSPPLGTSAGAADHSCRTFGFPELKPLTGLGGAARVSGRILDEAGRPILQLAEAAEISPGFSGGPLYDTVARRVIGMIVSLAAPDRYGRLAQTAFAVPAEVLARLCPEVSVSDLSPFRGLAAFEEEDAEFFRGRGDAIDRMLSVLQRDARFLAVFGPSGSGKSSLVKAGLLPRVRQGDLAGSEHWELMITRPADLSELERDLPGVTTDILGAATRWLARHPARTRLLLVLDQFEEIFVQSGAADRTAFLTGLGASTDSFAPLGIIVTMRDEFYSTLVREAPAFAIALERGLCNVPPVLSRRELIEIIDGPARQLGLRFEEGLVDRLANDTIRLVPSPVEGSAASTALSLLEFTLGQLWEGRRDGFLLHAVYERIGGITGGLARWADLTLEGLPEESRRLAQRILIALVHLGDEQDGIPDSRRRRTIASLCRNESERLDVVRLVDHLARRRLVVTGEGRKSEDDTVELIHDALLREWSALRSWLREDRHFLTWLQDLEQQRELWWRSNGPDGFDEGKLLRGRDLNVARDMLADRASSLTNAQLEFIERSQEVSDREQNRLRSALEEAERQRTLAESRLVASEIREQALRVLTLLPLEPVMGLILAMDAVMRNITELPDEMVDSAQISLHTALRQAAELNIGTEHSAPVTAVSISPDGKVAASAGADRTIRLWDLHGRPVGLPFTGHDDAVLALAFHPDGELIASGSSDRTIRLWDAGGRQAAVGRGHEGSVNAVAFHSSGRRLATGGTDRTVRVWDIEGHQAGPAFVGHEDAVLTVAYVPSGDLLVSGGADRTIRLWDRRGRPAHTPMVGHTARVTGVVLTPDGRTIVSGGADRTVRVWDREGYGSDTVIIGHASDVNGVVLLESDQLIVSASADGTLRAWNWAGESIGPPWIGHEGFVFDVAANRAGDRIASAGADGTIRLWDSHARPLGAPVTGHRGAVNTVAFSPDGTLLASGGQDTTVRLWRSEGEPVGEPLGGHRGEVRALAFSPDGTLLAAAGADHTIRLWRLDGRPVGELNGHQDEVRALAFSPDGGLLVTAGMDLTIRFWALDGEHSPEAMGEPIRGHTDGVFTVAFTPDGEYLASGSADRTIRLWNRRGNPVSEPLLGHEGGVWRVRAAADGQSLVSCAADGTLRTWRIGWRGFLKQACQRLSGHPGPEGLDAELARRVRAVCAERPWDHH